ncbi:hypothetical protein BDV93DRAFT_565866 [Ceratobasidium sp. AG-I]|nr:hypothetical protein BDV93DRAFT_565866 [Ceratobasidium sp. AG-I]
MSPSDDEQVLDPPVGGAFEPSFLGDSHPLDSDNPGDELGRNAAIWKMYASHAKKESTWVSEFLNEDLDVMLIFAGLFSAVVSAFLIESTKLLRQDPADVSAALLFAITESQRRMELNIAPASSPPVLIPGFTASPLAIVINIIWFTALRQEKAPALICRPKAKRVR